jgi:hypothetical protein
VDAVAEGGEDADAPVAELVADALDDDGAVVGTTIVVTACLVGEELEEVFRGLRVEVVFADQAADGGVRRERAKFADESADAAAEFEGPAGLIAVPEGQLARLPLGRA